jgi:hypothetical protein
LSGDAQKQSPPAEPVAFMCASGPRAGASTAIFPIRLCRL